MSSRKQQRPVSCCSLPLRTMRALIVAALLCVAASCVLAAPARYRVLPSEGSTNAAGHAKYLAIEFLSDTMVHFEVSGNRDFPESILQNGIYATQMIAKTNWDGPTSASEVS